MLDQKDLSAIRGVIREEFHGDELRGVIQDVVREEFKGEILRGVIREEFKGEAFRDAMREELQGEGLRSVMREEIGNALEQVVLPRFGEINDQFEKIDQRFEKIDQRFDTIDQRLNRIEANMVTKDYLEDRLVDFKATLKETGGRALRQIKCLATEIHRNGGLTAKQVVQATSA